MCKTIHKIRVHAITSSTRVTTIKYFHFGTILKQRASVLNIIAFSLHPVTVYPKGTAIDKFSESFYFVRSALRHFHRDKLFIQHHLTQRKARAHGNQRTLKTKPYFSFVDCSIVTSRVAIICDWCRTSLSTYYAPGSLTYTLRKYLQMIVCQI